MRLKSKFKVGDRVRFTWAGARFNQEGSIEYVRKDGLLIVHFDADPPGAILVVQPYEVDPISPKKTARHPSSQPTKSHSTKALKTIGTDAGELRWKKIAPGIYHATSPWGLYTIDGNNAGRNRWTVTYPDSDYGMVDSFGEAKAWAAVDEQGRASRAAR